MADPAPPAAPQPRLDALTILRFFAACWVIALHLQSRAPLPGGPWWHRFCVNGAYAMTLFFVLSGVVLAYGYHRMQPTSRDVLAFYRARFARIYAPYAALHLLALIGVAPTNAKELATLVYANVLSALGLQAWFPYAVFSGANSGTWSISAEFFFYALFPALLPLLAWLRTRWGTGRVCVYLALLSGLIGWADYIYPNAMIFYYMPAARLPEFMLGVVLGLELLETPRHSPRCSVLLPLAALVALAAALNPTLDYGLWIRANLFVVPALAWLIFELARWDLHRARPPAPSAVWRTLLYLGESSYCLFLAQMGIMLLLESAVVRTWRAHYAAGSPGAVWLAALGASFVGAIALHELVEKPVRLALLRHWSRPTA